ncbi:MAG: N-acetylmuramic acid 6-phosphate etherase [Candidatus Eremiobacteraeota bacterium]|nr:N-acetylmuramic acid 6-phosphate etherase [Candidatus Eremiobacteraeota bacterium]
MNDAVPSTEAVNPKTRALDSQETHDVVAALVRENVEASATVAEAVPALRDAVELVARRLENGGRLHYVGAGTSGRLAMVDAAEWHPTFGVSPELVQVHMAGGPAAFRRSVEGAEDDAVAGQHAVRDAVHPRDAVIGVSASGGAPFVVAALSRARELGAVTIALTSVAGSALTEACEFSIVLHTGAEPIAGSTRMKAGTAQKIALSVLSTAVMVRLGKVYDNVMIDVVASNEKLRRRALRLVARLVPADADAAAALLRAAGGNVKVAVVMGRHGIDATSAEALLSQARGRLRSALERGAMPQ